MAQRPVPEGPPKSPISSPATSRAPSTPPSGVPRLPSPPANAAPPDGVSNVPPLGPAPSTKPPSAVARAGGPVSAVVLKAKAEHEIMTGIERLPSLPTVIFEVMQIANNPKSSAVDFEQTLRQDQVLTARVLKLVNSSFFARQRKVTTISESVVILGFNTLKSIVIAASAARVLSKKMEGYGYGEYGLWKHSFATALTSKILATSLCMDRLVVEEVFVAGLLHDIGKLVLDPIVRERIAALKEEVVLRKKPRLEAERSTIGFDHTEIGVKVAKKWNLPDHVEEAIAAHHAIENAREHGKIAAIVAFADNLVNAAGVGLLPGKTIESPIAPMVLEVLSIQSGDVEGLRRQVEAEMDNIRTLCDHLGAS